MDLHNRLSFVNNCIPKDLIEKKLIKVYDEFQELLVKDRYTEITENEFIEKVKRKERTILNYNDNYQIINSYHVHCFRCNDHLYCHSSFHDTNSFFQKHINTDYHKAAKLVTNLSDNEQMIIWEIFGMTGHCNVCNISQIKAFVFETGLDVDSLCQIHECFKKKTIKFENDFRSMEIVKKLCSLTLLKQMFCGFVENFRACFLCSKILNSSDSAVKYHLVTNEHCFNFLMLVKSMNNFTLKDLLNGFNLEIVLRNFLSFSISFKTIKTLKVCSDKEICEKMSNSSVYLYKNISNYIEFAPKTITDVLKFNSNNLNCNTFQSQECLPYKIPMINSNHLYNENHKKHMGEILREKTPPFYNTYVQNTSLQPFNNVMEHYTLYVSLLHNLLLNMYNINTVLLSKNKSECSSIQIKNDLTTGISKHPDFKIESTKTSETDFKADDNGSSINGLETTFSRVMHTYEDKIVKLVLNNLHLAESKISTVSTVATNSVQNDLDKNSVVPIKAEKCNTNSQRTEHPNTSEEERVDENVDRTEQLNAITNESALLIPKVPKKLYAKLYNELEKFGKIKEYKFEDSCIMVDFMESEAAQKLVQRKSLRIDNIKVNVFTPGNIPESYKRFKLNEEVSDILKSGTGLINFALTLLSKANEASHSVVEAIREKNTCIGILMALKSVFPTAKCYIFGSRITGLSFTSSDLDVFLDCREMYYEYEIAPHSYQRMIAKKVFKVLKNLRNDFGNVEPVFRARVPIVRFVDLKTDLRCDLSFGNGSGVQKSLLIRYLVGLDWRVKPVILFLKYVISCHALHGYPNFSSYALTLMVIFYLQIVPSPILPTIDYLQNTFSSKRLTIEGWDCNFGMSSLPKTTNKDSLSKLTLGFFHYYSNFDYCEYVISPLTGTKVPRKCFTTEYKNLPLPYKKQFHNFNPNTIIKENTTICVLDPYNFNRNVTFGVKRESLNKFIYLCKMSFECLEASLSSTKEGDGVND